MAMTKEKAITILDKMVRTAKGASTTGEFSDGVWAFIKAYNGIYTLSIENGWLEDDGIVGLYNDDDLPSGTSRIDHLGVCALLLKEMLALDE